MPASEFVLVETTYPARPRAAAQLFARHAVDDYLAACANVGAAMWSVYRWKGKTETAHELVVSFKTTRARATALTTWIAKVHPYETPYVGILDLALPTSTYADWVRENAIATAPTRALRPPPRRR